MSSQHVSNFLMTATLAAGMSLAASGGAANAGPVIGDFQDDLRGDAIPGTLLTAELGDAIYFPIGTSINYHDHRLNAGITAR